MVPPEQMAKAEEAANKAKQDLQLAQQQNKLQALETKNLQAAAGANKALTSGLFGRQFASTMNTINGLRTKATNSQVGHGLFKVAETTSTPSAYPARTRSGKPWPAVRADGSPWPTDPTKAPKMQHPSKYYADAGIDYKSVQEGKYGQPTDATPGVGSILWKGVKDPASMLTIARAGLNGTGIAGNTAVQPLKTPWRPFNEKYEAGTVGALLPTGLANSALDSVRGAVNWTANIPRHLVNAGMQVGATGLGAASHLGQAAYNAPSAAGEIYDAARSPEGLLGSPTSTFKRLAAMGSHFGTGLMNTAETALTVAPGAGTLARAGAYAYPLLSAPLGNWADNRQIAARSGQFDELRDQVLSNLNTPTQAPAGPDLDWLRDLFSQLGPYLKGLPSRLGVEASSAPMISEIGKGGLPVRSPSRIF